MDFSIQIRHAVRITDNITIYITETLTVAWLIIALFSALALTVHFKSKKWDAMKKPTGLQNIMEFLVSGFENLFKGSAGEKIQYLAPWYFSLFAFLIAANTIGVTGLRPPTADWSMTFPLAIFSLVLIQFAGLRHRPKEYLKGFLKPHWAVAFLFLPINLMGEIAKPIALSFRLFGNILGGVILMSLLYGLAPVIFRLGFPAFLHAYFDIAVGILQAFIFTMISMTFAGMAAED
jgi:F-type H+-transporting ATPase subunit a